MIIVRLIAVILLLLLAIPIAARAGDVQRDECASLPLLGRYERAGLLNRSSSGKVVLRLIADLHFADCGAPDCYGTNITLTLELVAGSGGCSARVATINTQDFAEPNCGEFDSHTSPVTETYEVMGDQIDLSSQNLEKLTFRNKSGSKALVILRQNFFYFDDVAPKGILREELPGDDAGKSCCWGATSSKVHFSSEDE